MSRDLTLLSTGADGKPIGGYRAAPTLTVGKNGVMLFVQLAASSPSAARLQGQDAAARVVAGQEDLRRLHASPDGALTELLNMPFAIWYFAPPPVGSSVKKIEVRIKGDTAVWGLEEGRAL